MIILNKIRVESIIMIIHHEQFISYIYIYILLNKYMNFYKYVNII